MADFTRWDRQNFGDPEGVPSSRGPAQKEVMQDLQKPIQQLMCDVHEMAKENPDAADCMKWMMVRMASMNGRVALEHERVGRKLVSLTHILVWLTVVLTVLTGFLIWDAVSHHESQVHHAPSGRQ